MGDTSPRFADRWGGTLDWYRASTRFARFDPTEWYSGLKPPAPPHGGTLDVQPALSMLCAAARSVWLAGTVARLPAGK